MNQFLVEFLHEDSGAAAAEYALILAIVGAGIGAASYALGSAISTSLGTTASDIENCMTSTNPTC